MKSVLCSTLLIASAVAAERSQSANAAAAYDTADSQLVAQSGYTAHTGPAPSAGEISATFRSPSTGVDLLQNLKVALDRDVLLDLGFYDEANLRNFFNQPRVKWQTPKLPERLLADAVLSDARSTAPAVSNYPTLLPVRREHARGPGRDRRAFVPDSEELIGTSGIFRTCLEVAFKSNSCVRNLTSCMLAVCTTHVE
jgi:hypothetical protein